MARGRLRQIEHLDKDVHTLALERVDYLFDTFDHALVMFSGGKDSTATLQVALEVAHSSPRHARHLPLRAVFFDEEAIPYETEEYVRRVSQRDDVNLEWMCLPVQHRNACSRRSPYWWPWAPEARDKWCRPLPPEAITSWPGFVAEPPSARMDIPNMAGLLAPPHLGNVVQMLGIRADESLMRRRSLTQSGRAPGENYIVKADNVGNGAMGASRGTSAGNLWKAYPVYDWSTEDVWTAPATLGWDYNRAYDRLEMAGVSHSAQRCSPAFGEEPLQKLHTYAACFPEVWDRMVDRVPGVGAAARYALTELYAYGSRPEKPAGMLWSEFVARYLAKFTPEDAKKIARRIGNDIHAHYRLTSDPILAKAGHPVSGVSWTFLLTVAMRGDFKGRKQPGASIQTDDERRPKASYWHKYVAELTAHLRNGTFAELGHPGAAPANPLALLPEYAKETYTP